MQRHKLLPKQLNLSLGVIAGRSILEIEMFVGVVMVLRTTADDVGIYGRVSIYAMQTPCGGLTVYRSGDGDRPRASGIDVTQREAERLQGIGTMWRCGAGVSLGQVSNKRQRLT